MWNYILRTASSTGSSIPSIKYFPFSLIDHDITRGGGNDTLNRSRSRSVGQILETNFDDPEPSPSINTNGHSRSMEGPHLAKLSLTPQLLETGLWSHFYIFLRFLYFSLYSYYIYTKNLFGA